MEKSKKKNAEENVKIAIALNELRKMIAERVPTKDEVVPDEENIAKDPVMNDAFDIDIFFSRKSGMRRSLQLITSNATGNEKAGMTDEAAIKISCITALCSLCDTMLANKELCMSENDILIFMSSWLQQHNISPLSLITGSDKDA